MGLLGNLTAAEILEQVFHVTQLGGGTTVSNVVFMGMVRYAPNKSFG